MSGEAEVIWDEELRYPYWTNEDCGEQQIEVKEKHKPQ